MFAKIVPIARGQWVQTERKARRKWQYLRLRGGPLLAGLHVTTVLPPSQESAVLRPREREREP